MTRNNPDEIEKLYNSLQTAYDSLTNDTLILLAGDFNKKVGKKKEGETSLGSFSKVCLRYKKKDSSLRILKKITLAAKTKIKNKKCVEKKSYIFVQVSFRFWKCIFGSSRLNRRCNNSAVYRCL